MPHLYGKNQAGQMKFPPDKASVGEVNGAVVQMYDEFTLTGALNSGDLIHMGILPAGSRILEVILFADDIDGSVAVGEITVGTTGLQEGVGGSSVAELIPSTAVAAAAVVKMSAVATNLGLFKKTTAPYEIGIKATATSTGLTGKLRLAVLYVMD